MSIHQTKKDTADKKLQKIQEQLHGKQIHYQDSFSFKATTDVPKISSNNQVSDIKYLHQSLIKISIISFLAIGIQILLFYLQQNHYINLNLFNII